MASSSLKTPRQLMMKCTKQERQVDRETRAFVALQNRKISRRNDIEKKRGIPLMEISSDENKAQNCQELIKTEDFTISKKHADPIKEALKKWQREKRLRQIKEKNTKKQPFRISHVSHQLSEYSHSFQNETNKIKKIMSKNVTNSHASQKKNYSSTREAMVSSSAREKKPDTNNATRPASTRSSSRAMKTRSMARIAATLTNNVTSVPVPMEADDIRTSQPPSCTRNLPGCVTRSRSNVDRAIQQSTRSQSIHPINHAPASIPNDFSFNVPVGVESFVFCGGKFKFTPLSPNSAKKFFPTDTPVRKRHDEIKRKLEIGSSRKRNGAPMQVEVCDIISEDVTTTEIENTGDKESNEEALDAKYFRNMANSEKDRLKSCCAHWESVQEEMVPEEVKGKIRTVIGQVQLLVTKKFKQFSGLLELSEDATAKKKALVSDLQGFWEMMYLQVEDIDKKFAELEEMRNNNWEEKKVEVKKKNGKRIAKAKKTASKTANPKVFESRNRFREMRAQMKTKLEANKNEEQDAFKIILTPMKNKKANADPSVPEIVLTPVRRSTRKSRGCANITIPLINLPSNVSVDLFGACKTPELIQKNENLSNLDDDIFLSRQTTPVSQFLPEGDLMTFTPTTPAKRE